MSCHGDGKGMRGVVLNLEIRFTFLQPYGPAPSAEVDV